MVNNGARELGNMIAGLANRQSRTEENLTGDDATGGLLIFGSDEVVIDESAKVYNTIITGVLVVGHPVMGEVNNSDYVVWDGTPFSEDLVYEYN